MRIYIDPPEGYLYGFPKIYDPAKDGTVRQWLVKEGYPAERINQAGTNLQVRSWHLDATEKDFTPGIPTLLS
jgi:hypothetical protein